MKIYISIPISNRDLATQRDKAKDIARKIHSHGHVAVNPFDTPAPPDYMSDREQYAYYMGESIKRLLMCDAIYMCDGWRQSTGCQIESGTAYIMGIQEFRL